MGAKNLLDPILLEVLRNSLYSICDEMTAALIRTAYSTNIKDRRDCACGIYSNNGEVVAQTEAENRTPVHLGTMPAVVKNCLEYIPPNKMRPGDAIVMNIPYPQGPGHLSDIVIIVPVFYNDNVIFFLANQAHHVDVGGYAPGSMPFGVTEIYQEGLQIPPVRIRKEGTMDEEILSFIRQNVRATNEVVGDLMAQIAANNVGERRLGELINKYGIETLIPYTKAMLDYTEKRLLASIKEIPKGSYEFEDYIEGDSISEDLIKIKVIIHVEEERLTFDFSGSSPQVKGPLNCRLPSVSASVFYVVKAVLDPDLPPNEGAFRPLNICVSEGSVLMSKFPAAVCNSNIITTQRIVDVLLGALVQAIPEKVTAACCGTMSLFNIGGIDDNGQYFSYVETYGGGQGAMHSKDGMDGVQCHMTNTRNAPIEVLESTYPMLIKKYGLVPDSGGAGFFRGGMGMTREIKLLNKEATLTLSSDRMKIRPWGLFGGKAGGAAKCEIMEDNVVKNLGSKITISIKRGNLIRTVTPGGGGWGNPLEREPKKIWFDVKEELISQESAFQDYGVVLDPVTLEINEEKTAKTRKERI